MKKTAAGLLVLLASGLLLSACADDEDMWGHHHDHDRDRERDHDEHFSAVRAPAAQPAPVVVSEARAGS